MSDKIRRFLIGISYEGKFFSGFQEQPDKLTVEGVLKEIFRPYLHKNKFWQAMSRTDKGVNARINLVIANFKEDIRKKFSFFKKELEKYNIKLLFIEKTPINMPVRGLVKWKEYRYFLPKNLENYFVFNGERNLVVNKEIIEKIDWSKVKDLKELFKGKKYVENFSKKDKSKKHRYVTNFIKIEILDRDNHIEFIIRGDKFYWEEVRRLINVFISFLTGYLDKKTIIKMFEEKREQKPKAYPAEYLWLWDLELDV